MKTAISIPDKLFQSADQYAKSHVVSRSNLCAQAVAQFLETHFNNFNKSKINTIITAVITSNIRLSATPGNILLSTKKSKLPKESVINVSQLITIDKSFLTEKINTLPYSIMAKAKL